MRPLLITSPALRKIPLDVVQIYNFLIWLFTTPISYQTSISNKQHFFPNKTNIHLNAPTLVNKEDNKYLLVK
jgi:hypothetical protein